MTSEQLTQLSAEADFNERVLIKAVKRDRPNFAFSPRNSHDVMTALYKYVLAWYERQAHTQEA